MKKILFTGLMLAACGMGANAQNVGEEPTATFDWHNYRYGFAPIPSEYTKDGKELLTLHNGDDDVDITSFAVYNENLELVATIPMEQESYQNYTIIWEREGVNDPLGGGIKYTGAWSERRENRYEETLLVEGLDIWSCGSTSNYDKYIYLTQTLFNDDDAYEYIMPVKELQLTDKKERDRDGDGNTDYVEEEYSYVDIGFNIKSSNGQTIQTINLGSEPYYSLLLLTINDMKYLGVEFDTEEENYYAFYPIKPNSTGINPLGAPVKMKVSPRMADRSESFTVELDGDSNAEREVVVDNSAGQTVWKQKVPAGQRTVTIGAARLGKGVNVVRVNGGKGAESCKVIVK